MMRDQRVLDSESSGLACKKVVQLLEVTNMEETLGQRLRLFFPLIHALLGALMIIFVCGLVHVSLPVGPTFFFFVRIQCICRNWM